MNLRSGLAGTPSNDGRDPARPPSLAYIDLYANATGETALGGGMLDGFTLQSLGGLAAPIWVRPYEGAPQGVWFTVLPVGWTGEWHESPAPQWVTALSGRWWIETADGQRVEMGPGEIHWGQDQNTAGGRGHRSGQLGEEPCVQLMVRY